MPAHRPGQGARHHGKKNRNEDLLDGKGVERVLSRLTHEIIEKNKGAGQIVLVGIASGGSRFPR